MQIKMHSPDGRCADSMSMSKIRRLSVYEWSTLVNHRTHKEDGKPFCRERFVPALHRFDFTTHTLTHMHAHIHGQRACGQKESAMVVVWIRCTLAPMADMDDDISQNETID